MIRIVNPLIAAALLAGCAIAPAADHPAEDTVADGSEVQLGIGGSVRLADNGKLTYLSLVNDSRCPPKVQCVWAGDAEIALRWQPAGGPAKDIALHTASMRGSTNARIGERNVLLVSLERGIAPKATLKIERVP